MDQSILSATGINKTYHRTMITTSMLQERLLKRGLYRKHMSVPALRNVSLEVQRGEWVGIYGPNGSGKTTLLKILAGVLPADSGTVMRNGTISAFLELGVGFHPERRAEENIYLHGLLQGYSASKIRRLTEKIIAFAGIESHLELPIKCYSTGLMMRLAFATAAHADTDIYLFDEVLAVGDAAFQKQCVEHLESMKAAGKTAILVNHNLPSLERFCDRVMHMEKPQLLAELGRVWPAL